VSGSRSRRSFGESRPRRDVGRGRQLRRRGAPPRAGSRRRRVWMRLHDVADTYSELGGRRSTPLTTPAAPRPGRDPVLRREPRAGSIAACSSCSSPPTRRRRRARRRLQHGVAGPCSAAPRRVYDCEAVAMALRAPRRRRSDGAARLTAADREGPDFLYGPRRPARHAWFPLAT
jgi:hypothetical protein